LVPYWINSAIHTLERRLGTPYQTYSFTLTLAAQTQQYPIAPTGTTSVYRATRDIVIPWQSLITTQGVGQRINYLPHDKARTKYQLFQQITGNATNTGLPNDYSVQWGPLLATPGLAYWFWPTPDKAYTAYVDQIVFLPDLVAAQTPAQSNWFTLTVPDLVLYEALTMASAALDDTQKYQRFKPMRDEAMLSAVAATAELQFGEMGVAAGMSEPG
jgi:hypothetical protein